MKIKNDNHYNKIQNKFLENHWKTTWNSKSKYFSDIPLLITGDTAEFFKVKKKKNKQIKNINSSQLKKNLLELLFDLDCSCNIHLKWIYIKNKLKNLKTDSWNFIFNKISGNVRNDDHLWIGAKYSPSIKFT
jgi:hypothetical protein